MLNATERQRVDGMEIKCLISIYGVRTINRVRNLLIRRCGNELR